MDRRQFLLITVFSASTSGCVGGGYGDTTETNSPKPPTAENTPPTNSTGTQSSKSTTDDCEWPSMCEGSQIVEVIVSTKFDGEAVLTVSCRGEEFTVQPGESVRINRNEEGEVCQVGLSVNGDQVYSEEIYGYKSVTLTVKSNGEVEKGVLEQ